jgi:hypothetical protein
VNQQGNQAGAACETLNQYNLKCTHAGALPNKHNQRAVRGSVHHGWVVETGKGYLGTLHGVLVGSNSTIRMVCAVGRAECAGMVVGREL